VAAMRQAQAQQAAQRGVVVDQEDSRHDCSFASARPL
jgi:hypothetical protein